MKLVVVSHSFRSTGVGSGSSMFTKVGEFNSLEDSIEAILSHPEEFRPRFGHSGQAYKIVPACLEKDSSSLRDLYEAGGHNSGHTKEEWKKDLDGGTLEWIRNKLMRYGAG